MNIVQIHVRLKTGFQPSTQLRVLELTEYVETNTNKTLIKINKLIGKAEL